MIRVYPIVAGHACHMSSIHPIFPTTLCIAFVKAIFDAFASAERIMMCPIVFQYATYLAITPLLHNAATYPCP